MDMIGAFVSQKDEGTRQLMASEKKLENGSFL